MTPYQENTREKQVVVVGAALILVVGAYFIGKNLLFSYKDPVESRPPTASQTSSSLPMITPDVLDKKIRTGDALVLADIRENTAFAAEHIAHSLAVPISTLGNFSPEKNEVLVVIFSAADIASFDTAKNTLSGATFPYLFLSGGIEQWKASGFPLVTLGDPNSFVDQSKVNFITKEAYTILAATSAVPFFILDVQMEDNYKKKHLKGAVNIPLDTLEKRVGEIPAGRYILVYGENRLVSFQGGVRLSDLGIFTARTLEGNGHLSPESGLPLEP